MSAGAAAPLRLSLGALALLLAGACAAQPLQGAERPVRDEDAARAIFWFGAPEGSARLASSSRAQPARNFPCANCHGRDGRGGAEGGVAAPPIAAASLAEADRDTDRAYGRAAFVRAMRDGVGFDGRSLGPAMPRYDLPDPAIDALSAYLAFVGADETRGVAADAVRFGLAAPEDGAFARALRAALAQDDEEIFGRRLVFAHVDAADLDRSDILAVVGTPSSAALSPDHLRKRGLPDLFPLRQLKGDENPSDARGLYASRRTAERAIAAELGRLCAGRDIGVAGAPASLERADAFGALKSYSLDSGGAIGAPGGCLVVLDDPSAFAARIAPAQILIGPIDTLGAALAGLAPGATSVILVDPRTPSATGAQLIDLAARKGDVAFVKAK